VLLTDPVLWVDCELSYFSCQGEILADPHAAVVEEHVMVGTEAKDVVWRIWPVVWGAERTNMGGLRVGPG
jgi:hypothetical protein